ncbi:cobalt ECF transporter T component CbiQ [Thermostichus vulcanus]|uniref:Cobalt ECF transporter T component CbiQ n=1 Tax=Thermostichus vulcanus str. 'Rupite' TaxID=2813851 RepID=A0ABT0C6K7_THEVL|nr:cobalt ECF transporter T component CbiQ [Thermostichus vulcanus]MCJ2541415.1 cobalt ECF transporter T component CbiQ [Thermostichus vulcanus str. 'Rupite']
MEKDEVAGSPISETAAKTLSWIHRWRPLPKLLGLLGLVVAFAAVQRLALLPVLGVVAAGLWGLSGLPWRLWLRRLAGPGVLVSGLILVLPFWLGETVLWRWGSLAVRWEGIAEVLRIGIRLGAIFTLSLLLLETTPLMELLAALRRLGIPDLLLELAWLTYRYLQELGSQWQQMRRAAQLRGWRPGESLRQDLPFLASLLGTLLVRSYERSERVYQALRLRGYGQGAPLVAAAGDPTRAYASVALSWGATGLALGIAGLVLGLGLV